MSRRDKEKALEGDHIVGTKVVQKYLSFLLNEQRELEEHASNISQKKNDIMTKQKNKAKTKKVENIGTTLW